MIRQRNPLIYGLILLLVAIGTVVFGRVIVFAESGSLQALVTIFLGIILEAIPFLLIGILVSSAIEVLVSEQLLERLIPKKTVPAILVASVAGLVFPVCECAIVPVAGRLAKKGVPLPAVVTFLLAVPIINPLVILSTFYAFNGRLVFLWLRLGGGLTIAVLVGLAISVLYRKGSDTAEVYLSASETCGCNCHCDSHYQESRLDKVRSILNHSFDEFFDIGRFFIAGAFLSAIFQTYVPRSAMLGVGNHVLLSVLILGALAYLLSVCSEADAFIARSFLGQFSPGAVTVFMTLGPMIDIKNTLMLQSRFNRRFIVILITLVIILNIVLGMAVNNALR